MHGQTRPDGMYPSFDLSLRDEELRGQEGSYGQRRQDQHRRGASATEIVASSSTANNRHSTGLRKYLWSSIDSATGFRYALWAPPDTVVSVDINIVTTRHQAILKPRDPDPPTLTLKTVRCIPDFFARCENDEVTCPYKHRCESSHRHGSRSFQDRPDRPPRWYLERIPCKNWMTGHCPAGSQCQDRHPPESYDELPYAKHRSEMREVLGQGTREGKHPESLYPLESQGEMYLVYQAQLDWLRGHLVDRERGISKLFWEQADVVAADEHVMELAEKVVYEQALYTSELVVTARRTVTSKAECLPRNTLDLHGIKAAEVPALLDAELRRARIDGYHTFTVIVGRSYPADRVRRLHTAVKAYCDFAGYDYTASPADDASIVIRLNEW